MAFGDLRGTLTANAISIPNPATISGSVVVVVGDLIYAVVGEQTGATTTTASDNLGNVYTATSAATDAGTSTGHAYWSRATVAGTLTTISVVCTGSTQNYAAFAVIIEGPFAGSPLDANPANITTDITSAFTCPTTGTLTQGLEVVIGWGVATGSTVWAATSPNLLAGQAATAAVLHTVIGYQRVAATTTVAPVFTAASNPTDCVLGTTSFKASLTFRPPLTTRIWRVDSGAALASLIEQNMLALTSIQQSPFSKEDWPNPRGPIISTTVCGWIDPTNIQLIGQDRIYGGPGSVPDYDWPNPKGYIPGVSLKTWIDQSKIQLIGQDRVYGNPGQVPTYMPPPNPRGYVPSISLKTWVDPTKILLIGQDSVYGTRGQVPDYDWPVPAGKRFPSDLRTFINAFNGNLFFQEGIIFRAPLIRRLWSSDPAGVALRAQSDVWQNTLLTTLGFAQFPFFQDDWPNPRGPAFSISLRTWLDLYKLNLVGQDSIYDGPGHVPSYDWPNPRGALPALSLRTWIDVVRQLLIGQDRVYGDPGQVPTYMPPPNPRGPTFPIDLRTYLQAVEIQLIGQDRIYAGPGQVPGYDWPNPRGYVPGISLRTWLDLYKLNLVGQDRFFGLAGNPTFDWPVPKGPIPGISLRTWLDTYKLNLIGQDRFFGLAGAPNFDWPNPRGPRYPDDLRTLLVNLLLSTLSLQVPFSLTDWPNPRSPTFPIALRSWLEGLKLNLLGQDRFFGGPGQAPANMDWPVPKGRVPNISLKTWIDQYKLNLVGQDRIHGGPGQVPSYDWPNPLRPDLGRFLSTWSQFVNLISAGIPSYMVNSEIIMALEFLATELSDPVLVTELLLALTADVGVPSEDLATARNSAPTPAEDIASQKSATITNTEFLTDLARGGMTPSEFLTTAAGADHTPIEELATTLADSDLPTEIISTTILVIGDAFLPIEWVVSLQTDVYTTVEALRRHTVDGGVPVETLLLQVTAHGAPTENVTTLEFAQRGPTEFVARAARATSGNLETLLISVGEARSILEWLAGAGALSDSWMPIEAGNDDTGFLPGSGFKEPFRFLSNLSSLMN